MASDHTLTVYLQESASTVNVSFVKDNGVLNLDVSTSAAATFSESVTVTGLTLHQSATFNDTLTASTISVDANKVLGLAGTEDYTLAAVISGDGSLTKSGENTITLSGANTYTGATRVEGGELVVTKSNANSSSSYYIAEEAKLKVDAFSGEWNKTITGNGTLSLVIDRTDDHGNKLTGIGGFTGVLEISKAEIDGNNGNINLTNFSLADDVSLRLISGNNWSTSDTDTILITQNIELAGKTKEDFMFLHKEGKTLELSGVVTGTYLTSGTSYNGYYKGNNHYNNLTLSGANSSIDHVYMFESSTLTVNADMFFGTITADNVVIGNETVLTLGGGTSETPVTHSIGKLSAASGSLSLGDYATLTLGGGTAEAKVTHNIGTLNGGTGSKLHLEANAEMETISTVTGSITVTGSGVYNMGSTVNSNLTGWTDSANWTGTVKLSGATFTGNDLSELINDASKIVFTDVTLNKKGNDVLKLAGQHGGSVEFYGTLSGEDGNLVVGGQGYSLTFNDNTSLWNGRIVADTSYAKVVYQGGETATKIQTALQVGGGSTNNLKHVLDVEFNNTKGMTVSGDINKEGWAPTGGKLNLTVKNKDANAEGVVTFTGEVGKQGTVNLNVLEGASAEFTHSSVKLDTVDVEEGAEISFASVNAQTVSLGTAATITKAEDKTAATMSKVQMSSTGIVSSDNTGGSLSDAKLSLVDLAAEASFTIKDMSLSNVTIAAANAETKVNLSGVSATDVQLTKGEFHMLDKAQPQVCTGGSAINPVEGVPTGLQFSTSLLNGMTLGADASMVVDLGDLSGFTGMDSGKPTFSITLNGFSIEGFKIGDFLSENPGIYFAADSWLGQLLVAQGASQYVKGDSLEAGAQAAAGTGSGVSVSYNSTAVGTVIIISGLQVPEPATSALGLIALTALVSRRRRK